MRDEGLEVQFVFPPDDPALALREGAIDFLGASPYIGLAAFPGWRGGKILCALSQFTYWFLALRADPHATRGDASAVKGHRISATGPPSTLLKRVLEDAGIDLERDQVQIVPAPRPPGNWARVGAEAIEQHLADGFWGNAMRVAYAERLGLATVLLDIRRGDGPPGARDYTFPALLTNERLVAEHPEAAAGAVRAIVKTQRALRSDPTLAAEVGKRLFPPEEADLIEDLIARDVPFYDPVVSEATLIGASRFA